jgi:hypothetical protein
MPQRLTDMEIHEISLVDEPANEEARVVIVKAKSSADAPKSASVAKIAGAVLAAIEEMAPQIVGRAMAEGFSADPDAAFVATAILQETVMDMEAVTKALEVAEAKLDALEKRATEADAALVAKDEIIKAKDKEIAAAKAKGDDKKVAEEGDDEDDEEEVMKSLPESIRKRLADAEAMKVEIAKANEKRELDAAIEKAKSLGAADAEAVGALLLRITKGMTTADDAATLETMLKSTKAVDDKSPLFKSVGTSAAADGDPEAVLKAKADELVTKSAGKLTFAQAYDQALVENPDLYNSYIAKRRA